MSNAKNAQGRNIYVYNTKMQRKDLSPTVLSNYILNPTWFNVYSQENRYDPEGFDAYGYNIDGMDRAGYAKKDYDLRPAFDEEDQAYDHGWHIYHEVFYRWCAYAIDRHVCVPMPIVSVARNDTNVFRLDDVMCGHEGEIVYSDPRTNTHVTTSLENIVKSNPQELSVPQP